MTLRPVEILEPIKPPAPSGPMPQLEWVPVASLVINEAYQRPIESRGRKNIRKIAENFQWGRFAPLMVARGPGLGQFSIIDGQHRAHAAALCRIKDVPALVVDMSLQEQAASFSWVNGSVTALTPLAIYRAALAAAEPWALQCDAVVSRGGGRMMTYVKSASSKVPGEVFCVAAVRKIVEAGQGPALSVLIEGMMAASTMQDAHFYGSPFLVPVTHAVHQAGLTRGDLVAEFLETVDPWVIEAKVTELRKGGEFEGVSTSALTTRSYLALIKAWARERRA